MSMELFSRLEQQYGLPAGYLNRTWQIESSSGRALANPRSNARGHFQFMPATARAYGLTDPNDLAASADAAARLARDNMRALQRAGFQNPDGAALYLAHQQGPRGAVNLLRGADTPATNLVGRAAVTLNAGRPDMTGLQFAQNIQNKFNAPSFRPPADAPTPPPRPAFGPLAEPPAPAGPGAPPVPANPLGTPPTPADPVSPFQGFANNMMRGMQQQQQGQNQQAAREVENLWRMASANPAKAHRPRPNFGPLAGLLG
jgi:hypothetical protein